MLTNLNELLNGSARRAVHTTRYSRHAVHRTETVAEHVYDTMIYASVISHHLMTKGYNINLGLVLNRALWHDTEEPAGLGDILRGVKHSSPELHRMLNDLGRKFVEKVADDLQMTPIIKYWESAKDVSTEGQIVVVADVLSVVSYLIEEHRLGNRTLGDVHIDVLEYLDIVRSSVLITELKEFVWNVKEHFEKEVTRSA